MALQRAGRPDEAIDAYRRAIAHAPEDVDSHFNLGTALDSTGNYASALRSYERALALAPEDEARIWNNIGSVHSARADVRMAASAYAEAIEADPELADGWYNLGNVLLGMGRHAEAEARILRALKLAPQHPIAPRKLEHVRGEATRALQDQHEMEQQLADADAALESCNANEAAADDGLDADWSATADDGNSCLEALIAASQKRREEAGPMLV